MFNFRTVKKYFNFFNLFTSLLLKAVKGVTFSLNNPAVIMTVIHGSFGPTCLLDTIYAISNP